MPQTKAHWRSIAEPSGERELQCIPITEMGHITLAASEDVTELSAPRVNYLMGQARQAEREFIRLCELLDVDTDATPKERAFIAHLTEDRAGPDLTVSLRDVPDETKEMLAKRASELVNDWMEYYWSAKRKAN